jgi:hypothetical protein
MLGSDLADEAGARRLRRASLALARMAPVDRDWILGQLSAAERARLSEALGGAGGFEQLVQTGLQPAQKESLSIAALHSPVETEGAEAAPPRLQVLANISQSPTADWLARALAQTLASVDAAQVRRVLPRSLRKQLTADAPSTRLTPLAARGLADAADEAGASRPAQALQRVSTGYRLARWLKRGRP